MVLATADSPIWSLKILAVSWLLEGLGALTLAFVRDSDEKLSFLGQSSPLLIISSLAHAYAGEQDSSSLPALGGCLHSPQIRS